MQGQAECIFPEFWVRREKVLYVLYTAVGADTCPAECTAYPNDLDGFVSAFASPFERQPTRIANDDLSTDHERRTALYYPVVTTSVQTGYVVI
jgi:hypothetical protein